MPYSDSGLPVIYEFFMKINQLRRTLNSLWNKKLRATLLTDSQPCTYRENIKLSLWTKQGTYNDSRKIIEHNMNVKYIWLVYMKQSF